MSESTVDLPMGECTREECDQAKADLEESRATAQRLARENREMKAQVELARDAIRIWKSHWDVFGKDHPEVFESDRQQALERLAALEAAQQPQSGK